MGKYDYVLSRTKAGDKRGLTASECEELRKQFDGLPDDYLLFLSEVGYGEIGGLSFYSGPVPPEDIYGNVPKALASVVHFADDMQGYCFGFDTASSFRVVEVDPRGDVGLNVEAAFAELIQGYFGK
jgi:hypothetical protein